MELTPQQEMDFENQDHEWMYAGEEQGPEDRWQQREEPQLHCQGVVRVVGACQDPRYPGLQAQGK